LRWIKAEEENSVHEKHMIRSDNNPVSAGALGDAGQDATAAKAHSPATVPAAWPTGMTQMVRTVGVYRQPESIEASGHDTARPPDAPAFDRSKTAKQGA
jgi:hypothetical protein